MPSVGVGDKAACGGLRLPVTEWLMYFKRQMIKATMITKQLDGEERAKAGKKENLTRMIQAWFREKCEVNRVGGEKSLVRTYTKKTGRKLVRMLNSRDRVR